MSQPRGFKAIVGAFTWTCWHVDNFASLIYETFDPGMERPNYFITNGQNFITIYY